jgi:hypothetical protein
MALKIWQSMDKPLSYGDGTTNNKGGYQLLLIILDEDAHNPITELQPSLEQYTYNDTAELLFSNCGLSGKKIARPVSSSGSFHEAVPLGLRRIGAMTRLDPDQDMDTIYKLTGRMLRKMDINLIPWCKSDWPDNRSYATRGDWWMKIKHTGSTVEKDLQRNPSNQHQILV